MGSELIFDEIMSDRDEIPSQVDFMGVLLKWMEKRKN
jgi:hypothetical protein